jgi:hypothetical protein
VPPVPSLRLLAERRIGETLGAAVRTLAADFPSYLLVGFAYAMAVRGALALFTDPLPTKSADESIARYRSGFDTWAAHAWPVLAAITLLLPIVSGIIFVMVQEQLAGSGVSIRRAVVRVSRRSLPLVVTGLAVTLLVGVGLFLILPGVVLAVFLCLATPVAALEDVGPIAALRLSAQRVRGRWWRTLLAGVVILATYFVGLVVPDAIITGIGDPTSGLGLILSAAVDGAGFAFLMVCIALLYGDTRVRSERRAAERATAAAADAD